MDYGKIALKPAPITNHHSRSWDEVVIRYLTESDIQKLLTMTIAH